MGSIFDLFKKPEDEKVYELRDNDYAKFKLLYDDFVIGYLEAKNKEWKFFYSDEYKKNNITNYISGFPQIDKIYNDKSLWPFFKIRIPGLKQPRIMKIIEEENIDKDNEVELLKRFGEYSISNPYKLVEVGKV